MPSSITHAYLAKDIYQKLDQKIKSKIDFESYKTYSQGLDNLYFYHIFFPISKTSKKITNLGRKVHNEKTNELLIDLVNQIKISKNKEQFTYLIGLVTHYLTDSTIHPFINYQSSLSNNSYLEQRDNHFIMETYLDNYLINQREKINYKKFKGYNFCFNAKEDKDVKSLLDISFKNVFEIDDVGKYYFKSLKEMRFFFKYLRYDPYKIKCIFYQILNPFICFIFRDIRYISYNFKLNKDDLYLNYNHDKWFNIDNKRIINCKSFTDLYEEVINKSLIVIQELYNYIYLDKAVDLDKLFENRSYATGLILK